MISLSTGLRNKLQASKSLREILNRGCAKLIYYGGAAAPATADAAATGSQLIVFTNDSATVKAKQKIRFTPTPGTANAAEWSITLNGTKVSFTDDGTPSVAEICTELYNAWRAASGATAVTTPSCTINNPDVYQLFTLTDNTTSLDIESSTAGISFDYSAAVEGAGAGTGSWATSEITADAYGIQFEAAADVSSGIMELLSTQTVSGLGLVAANAVYWRLVLDADDGTLSTTQDRIQGSIATANADIIMTGTTLVVVGATYTLDTLPITIPAS